MTKQAHVRFDQPFVEALQARYGYAPLPDTLRIGLCADTGFLRTRFIAHDNIAGVSQADSAPVAIVTGFGPTNAPTAGTLSAMLTACELQRRSQLHTTVVISDLGAWNSRNLAWSLVESYRERMLTFLRNLGFDEHNGVLRTHQDTTNLILSGRIAKVLTEQDFRENRESLDELYTGLGVRGSMLGVMLDGLYTIADILGPLCTGHGRILMLAGIEEHYFSELSKLVLRRCRERFPDELFPKSAAISALFLGIVPGLQGHPKMSKSIPQSAIHLGESAADIRRKILDADPQDDSAVLRMMEVASGWTDDQIIEARACFENRASNPRGWAEAKAAYAELLLTYARLWQA